ncbi:hypothetical protein JVT61DRAFT_14691 [Boletus reticuloceps]|uniref:Uncharacterized protein n=1 Tax=Boletus reticuloceps TaxID=495285 RepID=A0A8I2YWJ6_9AGAM|nr:hypothetical protein JVT61DRAFT_14691 [Boletus reticuloceps]
MLAAFEVHTEDTLAAGHSALKTFSELMREYIAMTQMTLDDSDAESDNANVDMDADADVDADIEANAKQISLGKNWNFPKMHLNSHVFDDIILKGATRNFNTKPNESMHRPLKQHYRQTNFKNTAEQLLRLDHWTLIANGIRTDIDELDQQGQDDEADAGLLPDIQNIQLGSIQHAQSFHSLEESHKEDSAFQGFRIKLNNFLNIFLPAFNIPLPGGKRIHLKSTDEIIESRFLRVHYESLVDWKQHTDYLRCSPLFYNHPRYDCVIVHIQDGFIFARLVFMFTCNIEGNTYPLGLIQPYDVGIGFRTRKDKDLRLWRCDLTYRLLSTIIKSRPRRSLLLPLSLSILLNLSDLLHRLPTFSLDSAPLSHLRIKCEAFRITAGLASATGDSSSSSPHVSIHPTVGYLLDLLFITDTMIPTRHVTRSRLNPQRECCLVQSPAQNPLPKVHPSLSPPLPPEQKPTGTTRTLRHRASASVTPSPNDRVKSPPSTGNCQPFPRCAHINEDAKPPPIHTDNAITIYAVPSVPLTRVKSAYCPSAVALSHVINQVVQRADLSKRMSSHLNIKTNTREQDDNRVFKKRTSSDLPNEARLFEEQEDHVAQAAASESLDAGIDSEPELATLPNPDYMSSQKEPAWSMHGILLDWLVQVHARFRLLPETFFLVGITYLFVATKVEEIVAPSVSHFLHCADSSYTESKILLAERYVLKTIEWNMSYPNLMHFLRCISKADDYDVKVRTIGKYLLEVRTLEWRLLATPPSLMAAASIWLARLILGNYEWSANLAHYSFYAESSLLPTANLMLNHILKPIRHESFHRKYVGKRFLKVSIWVREWALERWEESTRVSLRNDLPKLKALCRAESRDHSSHSFSSSQQSRKLFHRISTDTLHPTHPRYILLSYYHDPALSVYCAPRITSSSLVMSNWPMPTSTQAICWCCPSRFVSDTQSIVTRPSLAAQHCCSVQEFICRVARIDLCINPAFTSSSTCTLMSRRYPYPNVLRSSLRYEKYAVHVASCIMCLPVPSQPPRFPTTSTAMSGTLVSDAGSEGYSSDAESVDISCNLDILSHGATIADYQKVNQNLQLKVQKLQEKLRLTKEENATLRANQRKRIMLLGRKYGVMVELFVPPASIFQQPCPSPAPPFDMEERYKTKASDEAALISELHAFVANPELIPLLKTPHFHSTFEKAANTTRSSLIHNLRNVMGSILDLPSGHFQSASFDRESVPEIRALLGVSAANPREYKLLFPALYKDKITEASNLFGNWQVLAKILKVALFGPKSLDGRSGHGGPKTNGKLWTVTSLTPGAFAWAIIMLLFFLSPDKDFSKEGTGTVSKIPYAKWFKQYKKLLISRWTSPRLQRVIKQMDAFIFGAPNGGNVSAGPATALIDEIDIALAQLDVSDDESEDGPLQDQPAPELNARPLSPLTSISQPSVVSMPPISRHPISLPHVRIPQPSVDSQPPAASQPPAFAPLMPSTHIDDVEVADFAVAGSSKPTKKGRSKKGKEKVVEDGSAQHRSGRKRG